MKEFMKDRFNILMISFVVFGAIIIGQLVNLQVINGKRYDEESQRKLLNLRRVSAPRGTIMDRYGVPVAVNRIGYTAQIIKTKMKNKERDEMILKLVNIFEKNNDDYYKSLEDYLTIKPFAFGSKIKKSKKLIDKWKKEMVIKKEDVSKMSTPEASYRYMREKFKIDEKYSDEDAYKIMCMRYEMLIRGFTALDSLSIAKDISRETVAEIEERHQEFPGVFTDMEPYRKYINNELAAHVVGYVDNINEKEYEKLKEDGYRQNDVLGKVGIEASAESYLRGKDGWKKVEVDITGRLIKDMEKDNPENPVEPGNNVYLTLDMNLQRVAMESIKKNIEKIKSEADGKKNFGDAATGAAVVMDVNNGDILAMASYPSYDPAVFTASSEDKEAQSKLGGYFKDKYLPMYNRVTQGVYAPGSTFKPLVSIAALQEGIITPNQYIYDNGILDVDGRIFKCLEEKYGHGNLNLKHALETSCNIYFHKVGISTGIDNIEKWGKSFGLGQKTGIDIPNESKGVIASREYKKSKEYIRNFGEAQDWWKADTAQASIGQVFNSFTPLQLVNYVSAIANGGKLMQPHLIKKIVKADGSTVLEKKADYSKIQVKQENLNAVTEGMKAVAQEENGTAMTTFKGFPISVAGKTGTAETGFEGKNTSSNALWVCFAPADKPEIAIAIIIEHGAWGANTAPIAKDIMAEYFNLSGSGRADDRLQSEQVEFTH